jgi:hypothetical protein
MDKVSNLVGQLTWLMVIASSLVTWGVVWGWLQDRKARLASRR